MRRILTSLGSAVIIVVLSVVLIARGANVSAVVPGNVTLISENYTKDGQGGNNHSPFSGKAEISKDGRVVAYPSSASNLVDNDTNGFIDIFATNVVLGTTERVNVSTSGVEANAASSLMAISETGRYIAFKSKAGSLIDGQGGAPSPNHQNFLRDTVEGVTIKFSQPTSGNTSSVEAISNDGRYILFDVWGERLVWHDRVTNTNVEIGQHPGIWDPVEVHKMASRGSMSCDGSFVVFDSTSTLFTDNDTNGYRDIFIADMRGPTVRYTNITQSANNDSFGSTISCNGNYIGFATGATNLGSGHTSSFKQYYRYDRINAEFEHISKSSSGSPQNSNASTSNTSHHMGISDKGDVVYISSGTNLVSGVNYSSASYLRHVDAGVTELLSINSSGNPVHAINQSDNISADGKYSVLSSNDNILITGETNGYSDLFLVETGL